jgi:hypothetical protein
MMKTLGPNDEDTRTKRRRTGSTTDNSTQESPLIEFDGRIIFETRLSFRFALRLASPFFPIVVLASLPLYVLLPFTRRRRLPSRRNPLWVSRRSQFFSKNGAQMVN